MAVPRWIARPLMVAAALAAMAFMSNHQANPCTGHEVGAGGMCVTVQIGGAV